MSTKADVIITFKKDIPNEFKNVDKLIKALTDFFHETSEKDCDFEIYDLDKFTNEVSFELYSERHVHLLWQQDILIKYLKKIGGVYSINSNVWISSDESVYLETEEDIQEYV